MDNNSSKEMSLKEFIALPDTISIEGINNKNLQGLFKDSSVVRVSNTLFGGHAIGYINKNDFEKVYKQIGTTSNSIYPSVLGLLGKADMDAAGITQVQQQPFLSLTGQGILVGFIDTGIDYTKEAFIYEDGTSKVEYIWDQSIDSDTSPEGYYFGTEYNKKQINEALKSEDPFKVVPHKDNNGHGTFLASVAGSREKGTYIGAAPDADFIVVKLKKANPYYINKYLVPPEQDNVFESTNLMLGIDYILKKAYELNRPVSICISVGTNIGGHDGFSNLEEYISSISVFTGVSICCAAGNESLAKHHTSNTIKAVGETQAINIKVPPNASSFQTYIWIGPADRMSVGVTTPLGQVIERVPAKPGTTLEYKLVFENSIVRISYEFPVDLSGSQLITVSILNPTPGIWSLTLYGDIIIDGNYHAWLPLTGLVTAGIEFITPVPEYTIVSPATSLGSITCGAYNAITNSLYANSSWGPTRLPINCPDFVAPGVDVKGIYPSGYGTMSGTSVASAITAGATALMLEWGFVQNHNSTLDASRINAYLIRGCEQAKGVKYPNNQWGYGTLNLYNTFNKIK